MVMGLTFKITKKPKGAEPPKMSAYQMLVQSQNMEFKSFIAMKRKEFFLVLGKMVMSGVMRLWMVIERRIQELRAMSLLI
jgi:hypothetical protein